MRTTLNLPDALFEAAKQRAAHERRTFTSLVEEGLRAVLATPAPSAAPTGLPSYGHRDGPMLIDLEDRDALWAALDASNDSRATAMIMPRRG